MRRVSGGGGDLPALFEDNCGKIYAKLKILRGEMIARLCAEELLEGSGACAAVHKRHPW